MSENGKEAAWQRMAGRIQRLYPENWEAAWNRLQAWLQESIESPHSHRPSPFSQEHNVLITYADIVRSDTGSPLSELRRFVVDHQLPGAISHVHLLPFYPYSSDDGFSVIDYRAVDPRIGQWTDVEELHNEVDLMFDLVLNHCSSQSRWFQDYLKGVEPYDRYFVEADPQWDLSAVTRPRSLPLLTEFETSRGKRHVWTTFSADQVDLNFADPEVLLEFLDILWFYVQQGARIIRLDAIAYLWKTVGTSCIHLEQTHEVVKLCRDVLEVLAPDVWLLTETNVPHAENVSYFGAGDEAHMVYQFSLPPLLLDAFLQKDVGPLREWLSQLEAPPVGATYFNFTASHDGVGVRPLEGLVDRSRFSALVDAIRAREGMVSTRRQADGSDTPYELNVSYVSALNEPQGLSAELHARRFLSTQSLMLAMQGVPGIYFHSLVGSPNDVSGARDSGIPRRINRHKYERSELEQRLEDATGVQGRIFRGYQKLLATRRQTIALSPLSEQRVLPLDGNQLLGLERFAAATGNRLVAIVNVSDQPQSLRVSEYSSERGIDLLSGHPVQFDGTTQIEPFGAMWIDVAGSDAVG